MPMFTETATVANLLWLMPLCVCVCVCVQALIAEKVAEDEALDLFRHCTELGNHVRSYFCFVCVSVSAHAHVTADSAQIFIVH